MKYLLFSMILLFSLSVKGQQVPSHDDSLLIEDLFKDLEDSWNLGIIDETSTPDIWLFNKFKSLFDDDATIDDEFNAHFTYDAALTPAYVYRLKRAKPYYEYAHNIILELAKLSIDSLSPYQLMDKRGDEYTYKIYRKVSVAKKRRYVLEQPAMVYFDREFALRKAGIDSFKRNMIYRNAIYNDSDALYYFHAENQLLINIKKSGEEFKILSIRVSPGADAKLQCDNDADGDGILNEEDKAPGTFGDFTGFGREDYDFDGVTNDDDKCDKTYGLAWNAGCPWYYFKNKLTLNIPNFGVRFNNVKLRLPEPEQAGYTPLDMNLSKKGKMMDPGLIVSFLFGMDGCFYFTRSKNLGISFGLNYSTFKAAFILRDAAAYTYKANDGNGVSAGNDYRRRVTLHAGSNERVQFNVFNMPLLLKHRGRFTRTDAEKKQFFEISAGPSLLLYKNISDYDMRVDFEGLYQVDSNSGQLTYLNYFDEGSTWNIRLTGDEIDQQSENPGVDVLFQQLNDQGYDFAMNRVIRGKDNKSGGISLALNANIDYSVQLGNMIIKVGAGLMWAGRKNYLADYKSLDKSTDTYRSWLRQDRPFSYISYGINLGVSYGF